MLDKTVTLVNANRSFFENPFFGLFTQEGRESYKKDNLGDHILQIQEEILKQNPSVKLTEEQIMNAFAEKDVISYEAQRFWDGELQIYIEDIKKLLSYKVINIVHPIIDNDSILELCFLLDAISRIESPDARPDIILNIPYMHYGRQDRLFHEGNAIPAISVLKMILVHCEGMKELNFFDIHNDSFLKNLPLVATLDWHNKNSSNDIILKNKFVIKNQTSERLFASILTHAKDDDGLSYLDEDTVVVSADKGGINRATRFAKAIDSKYDIAIGEKIRPEKGEPEIVSINGQDVSGKKCVIVDDIADSGVTLAKTATMLKEKGATKVYACITHGVFSGGGLSRVIDEVWEPKIDKIFVTDTVISNELFDVIVGASDDKPLDKVQIIPYALFVLILRLEQMAETLNIKLDLSKSDLIFKIYDLKKKRWAKSENS